MFKANNLLDPLLLPMLFTSRLLVSSFVLLLVLHSDLTHTQEPDTSSLAYLRRKIFQGIPAVARPKAELLSQFTREFPQHWEEVLQEKDGTYFFRKGPCEKPTYMEFKFLDPQHFIVIYNEDSFTFTQRAVIDLKKTPKGWMCTHQSGTEKSEVDMQWHDEKAKVIKIDKTLYMDHRLHNKIKFITVARDESEPC